jgi:peptide/bleomycin uptake transporter
VFKSFFPQPKLFFLSALIWTAVAMIIWYAGGSQWGALIGLGTPNPEAEPVIGLGHFTTPEFLWFYAYYLIFVAVFFAFWHGRAKHPWELWSILGSALILFVTYFNVQVSVAINNWRRPFFDGVQDALSEDSTVTQADLFELIVVFCPSLPFCSSPSSSCSVSSSATGSSAGAPR